MSVEHASQGFSLSVLGMPCQTYTSMDTLQLAPCEVLDLLAVQLHVAS